MELKELGNLVILIGPNSSGKSNFLEILNRFFAEIDLTGMPPGIEVYSWFDGVQEEPIEISVTLKFDEKECEKVFPPEFLKIMKEKFGERYQEITICRQIIKAPTGWQTKSIKLAEVQLIENGKHVSIGKFAESLSKSIPLEDLQVVFFAQGPQIKISQVTGSFS